MCDRCSELEEKIAWLEGELGLQMRQTDLAKVQRYLHVAAGISALGGGKATSVAEVVLALYQARGRVVSKLQLMEAAPPDSALYDERNPKIVDVWIWRARNGLGSGAIGTSWGRGYYLTPEGLAKVSRILSDLPTQEAA